MKTIEVFDPAMCCSTGVCGPSVDPALARFAADVEWLAGQGVEVKRFNLAQQPDRFAASELVTGELREKGEECLPLVLVGGQIASEGAYPSRSELASLAGLEQPAGAYTPIVEELVAIGAALASNCESCLTHHVSAARELGVAEEDIAKAVRTARKVKDTPARSILKAADRLLDGDEPQQAATQLDLVQVNGSCCAGGERQPAASTAAASGSCC